MDSTWLLIRHGETLLNAEDRIQGSSDSPLTTKGEEEARRLGEYLIGRGNISGIVSSPTGRAFQTASIVAESLGLDVECDERLREINMGDWEGRKFDEVAENDRANLNAFLHHPAEFSKSGSEDFETFVLRIRDFCRESFSLRQNGDTLVVTHGAVILAFRLLAKSTALNDFWKAGLVPHTSISALKIGRSCQLLFYGETPHLDAKSAPTLLICDA